MSRLGAASSKPIRQRRTRRARAAGVTLKEHRRFFVRALEGHWRRRRRHRQPAGTLQRRRVAFTGRSGCCDGDVDGAARVCRGRRPAGRSIAAAAEHDAMRRMTPRRIPEEAGTTCSSDRFSPATGRCNDTPGGARRVTSACRQMVARPPGTASAGRERRTARPDRSRNAPRPCRGVQYGVGPAHRRLPASVRTSTRPRSELPLTGGMHTGPPGPTVSADLCRGDVGAPRYSPATADTLPAGLR